HCDQLLVPGFCQRCHTDGLRSVAVKASRRPSVTCGMTLTVVSRLWPGLPKRRQPLHLPSGPSSACHTVGSDPTTVDVARTSRYPSPFLARATFIRLGMSFPQSLTHAASSHRHPIFGDCFAKTWLCHGDHA